MRVSPVHVVAPSRAFVRHIENMEAECPACVGGAPRMLAEDMADEVVTFVTECEVCENTGRVSARLARALWEHQEPTA